MDILLKPIAEHGETGMLDDPYSEFFHYLQLSSDTFNSWRRDFHRCLPSFRQALADILNKYKDIGQFSASAVSSAEIDSAIRNPVPFNPASLNRFIGPTKGDSRVFDLTNGGPPVEAKAPIDYSTWAAPVERRTQRGEYFQKVSASGHGVIDPLDSAQIWKARAGRQVDLFVNVYSPDLGIVNWSSFFQYQKLHMRAVGYEMNGRLLWFNQMLNCDMTPTIGPAPGQPNVNITKDSFLVSVDFALPEQSQTYFCVYGLYIKFDFQNGGAVLSGPVFKMKNLLLPRGANAMISGTSPDQPATKGNGAAARATRTQLPDMNAETYPFEVVQHLLDEAAYFPLFSIPDCGKSQALLASGSSSAVTGMQISERLHRFSIAVDPLRRDAPWLHNTIGEPMARFHHRWMFAPDGFGALPGVEPPPTPLDPARSQRFVMLDSICTFDNGKDGFRGFGTGRTYPITIAGRPQLLAGALGIIAEGFGKFRNLQGIYTYCGAISPDTGFTGNLLCRVMDFQGVMRTQKSLPELQAIACGEQEAVYLLFRGQKKNKHEKTGYLFDTNGEIEGFELHPQIRILDIDCAIDGSGHLHSTSSIGPVIGNFASYVFFNVLNPGAPGTPIAPIRFTDYDNNIFTARDKEIGSFGFDGGAGSRFGHASSYPGEGRTFTLSLPSAPGQQALRFGGYAPIVNGKGIFSDISGLVADNSVVGVAPHAIATTYVARINDPQGRFRRQGHDSRERYICASDKRNSWKCERTD